MTRRIPFTIPDRTLVRKGVKRNVLQTMSLEQVRDYLQKMHSLMAPQDIKMPLSRLEVSFNNGQMQARIPGRPQLGHLKVMTNGASQLHSNILPSRFWAGFKQLAALDSGVANDVWATFAKQQYKKPRVLRVTRMSWCAQCGGVPRPGCGHTGREVHNAIRACVSTRYGLYSNLELVEDILLKAGHFATMPVLSWVVSDSGIRLRFLGLDPATAAFAAFDPAGVLGGQPLPMIEVWNSEVGRSTVGMAGGVWNVKTASGLGHWDERTQFTWRHVGNSSRISTGVKASFTALTQTAQAVVNAYTNAQQVGMADPAGWLKEQLGEKGKKEGIPERVVKAAIAALQDPDVTPGGKLASVVDAMTIAASNETDIYTASDVEKAASRLLKRGADIAAKNGGVIP